MIVKASKKHISRGAGTDSSMAPLRNRRSPSGRDGTDAMRDELAELRARPAKSIQNRYVVNLEDGRKYRMLTSRTLARFGLTPREYRMKWGLPPGQPLLATSLLATRRKTARELGLGERLRAAQRKGAPGPGDRKTRKQAPKKRRGRERSTEMVRRERPLAH